MFPLNIYQLCLVFSPLPVLADHYCGCLLSWNCWCQFFHIYGSCSASCCHEDGGSGVFLGNLGQLKSTNCHIGRKICTLSLKLNWHSTECNLSKRVIFIARPCHSHMFLKIKFYQLAAQAQGLRWSKWTTFLLVVSSWCHVDQSWLAIDWLFFHHYKRKMIESSDASSQDFC